MTAYTDQVVAPTAGGAHLDRTRARNGGGAGGRAERVGAWMGVAFAVLFVAGFMTFAEPDDTNDIRAWERWWTDSDHRVTAVVGAYLMIVGLGAFVWFMWSMHRRLRESGPMLMFGSLFVAAAMVSTMVRATIPGGKLFGGESIPTGDFARMFDSIGMALLLVPGALAAGMFVAIFSHRARRHGLLPAWLVVAGYVVAALQIAASAFFPFALFVLWVLVASIRLGAAAPAQP